MESRKFVDFFFFSDIKCCAWIELVYLKMPSLFQGKVYKIRDNFPAAASTYQFWFPQCYSCF